MPDQSNVVLLNAFQKGARIIEKHFTLDKLKGKKITIIFTQWILEIFKI